MKASTKNKKVNTLFRLDADVKRVAQRAARKIDIPLSSIVNNYLYYFSTNVDIALEYPSPRLIKAINDAEADVRNGNHSPTFTNAKDAIAWLHRQ